jgi:hypothetical protein
MKQNVILIKNSNISFCFVVLAGLILFYSEGSAQTTTPTKKNAN